MESKTIIIDGVQGIWTPEPVQPGLPAGYVSPHFRYSEFSCNHCGKYGELISMELIDVLETLRTDLGNNSVMINSGVRCETHNRNVGGASNSRHLDKHADAADIVVAHVTPQDVQAYLLDKYLNKYGIGKYNSFTHIDVRPGGPARW